MSAPSTDLPRLLLWTDRSQLRLGRGLVRTVGECVDAGLTHVVVREHDLDPGARSALIRTLVDIPGLWVISSRIPDPCAVGVHEPADTRCARGVGLRGRSCHDPGEVGRAAADGVDYVTLSPFATSTSKPGYGPPVDPAVYADQPLPVFALGGVGVGNAAAAREAGAHGVAVMGEVMRAGDPAGVTARFLAELR